MLLITELLLFLPMVYILQEIYKPTPPLADQIHFGAKGRLQLQCGLVARWIMSVVHLSQIHTCLYTIQQQPCSTSINKPPTPFSYPPCKHPMTLLPVILVLHLQRRRIVLLLCQLWMNLSSNLIFAGGNQLLASFASGNQFQASICLS